MNRPGKIDARAERGTGDIRSRGRTPTVPTAKAALNAGNSKSRRESQERADHRPPAIHGQRNPSDLRRRAWPGGEADGYLHRKAGMVVPSLDQGQQFAVA